MADENHTVLTPPPGWANWDEVMELALDQARQAALVQEVPVGAVVLSKDGEVLARAYNDPIASHDPSAHAEMVALRRAAMLLGEYRLPDTYLVCTLEPCLMCMGAMVHARIAGLIFGAHDPKSGVADSCIQVTSLPFLNHTFPIVSGVRGEECGQLLKDFFRARRHKSASNTRAATSSNKNEKAAARNSGRRLCLSFGWGAA
jgi:tRNA(adenine34) deaminase